MAISKLDKKRIKLRAKEILKTGISKQEAYELLVEELHNRAVTAKILRRLPSAQALKRYGVWNHILLGLLIITATMLFLANPTPGIIIWYGLLIIAVARKSTRFYFWVTIMSGLSLVTIIYLIFTLQGNTEGLVRILLLLTLIVPSCILPIWLNNKLTPSPDEQREFYENEHGEQRSRMIFHFIEK